MTPVARFFQKCHYEQNRAGEFIMIKSLLDADENPPTGTKVIIEDTTVGLPTATSDAEKNSIRQAAENEDILEIPPLVGDAQNVREAAEAPVDTASFSPADETFALHSKREKTEPPLFQIDYKPESQAETIRNSGLAYGAAITLFASVVFMMIIGWFADLLLGSSPWGIVGGIVLGSLVGFFQLFRMTSQILKNKD